MYTLPKDRDDLNTPQVEIIIDGEEIPLFMYKQLDSVTYESHRSGSDVLTIRFKDPFKKILSDPDFKIFRGSRISVRGGWKGNIHPWLINGHVAIVDAEFPNYESPMVTINCMDDSFILDRDKVAEFEYPDGDIVSLIGYICNLYDLEEKVPSELEEKIYDTEYTENYEDPILEEQESITFSNESVLEGFTRYAEQAGIEFKIIDGYFIWWKKGWVNKEKLAGEFIYKEHPFSIHSADFRVNIRDEEDPVKEADVTDEIEIEEAKKSKDEDDPTMRARFMITDEGEYEVVKEILGED